MRKHKQSRNLKLATALYSWIAIADAITCLGLTLFLYSKIQFFHRVTNLPPEYSSPWFIGAYFIGIILAGLIVVFTRHRVLAHTSFATMLVDSAILVFVLSVYGSPFDWKLFIIVILITWITAEVLRYFTIRNAAPYANLISVLALAVAVWLWGAPGQIQGNAMVTFSAALLWIVIEIFNNQRGRLRVYSKANKD